MNLREKLVAKLNAAEESAAQGYCAAVAAKRERTKAREARRRAAKRVLQVDDLQATYEAMGRASKAAWRADQAVAALEAQLAKATAKAQERQAEALQTQAEHARAQARVPAKLLAAWWRELGDT